MDGTVDYGRLNQELSQTGGTSLLSPAVPTGATSLPSPAVNLGHTHADTSALSEDTETPAKVAVADAAVSQDNFTIVLKLKHHLNGQISP